MINRSFFLFLTTALVISSNVTIASDSFSTHTQHTPMELKPAFLLDSYPNGSFMLASVCFLGSGTECGSMGFNKGSDDMAVNSVSQCKNEGYSKTSCSLPFYLSEQCPYNSAYYLKCKEDVERACNESGYTQTTCANGYVIDRVCPYSSAYVTCKENPCSGYSACECGASSGASACYSGSNIKYSSCKNCDPCSGYYECGGSWQYCTGRTCSADSSRCSVPCSNDYFPYSCSSSTVCSSVGGIYRNGYCSKSCPVTPPSNTNFSYWCCLPGDCDYDTCYRLVGYNCPNHPKKMNCVNSGGTPRFIGCVGPDYGVFNHGGDAGKMPPHNGAEFMCEY